MAKDNDNILDQLSVVSDNMKIVINNDNFLTPDMGDYYINNYSEEYLKEQEKQTKMLLDIDIDNEKITGLDEAFYLDNPVSTTYGYNQEYNVFVFKAIPMIGPPSGNEKDPIPVLTSVSSNTEEFDKMRKQALEAQKTNAYDGDTVIFHTSHIQDGDAPFTYNGVTYGNFRHYLQINNLKSEQDGKISLRLLGIDAPEVPHYIVIPKESIIEEKEFDYIDFVNNLNTDSNKIKKHVYKYEKNRERKNNTILFAKINRNEDEPTYHEIIDNDYTVAGDENAKYYLVVNTDESPLNNEEYARQAIEAKKEIEKLFNDGNTEDWIIVADGNELTRSKTKYTESVYRDWFLEAPLNAFLHPIEYAGNAWQKIFGGERYSKYKYYGYSGFGTDIYNRLLGALYIKRGGKWINVSKYLIAKFKKYELSRTSDPLINSLQGFSSSAFKLWEYDPKKIDIIDSLTYMSNYNFNKRRKIQRQIMQKDFKDLEDYTVMIGDCLFLVPPTSIRTINQTSAERAPLIRSRGSMTKGSTKTEKYIELTLFFNNEDGINGFPFKNENLTALPTGEVQTYYMNGLRSLIALFKLTPFLPIENKYINNVLNIDAVSLVSLQVTTMENYPKCLAATLLLQEFNYLTYMPELPAPDPSDNEGFSDNQFAKTINYELLRWYYQRPIQRGNELQNMDVTDYDFIRQTFGNKTTLIPMKFEQPQIKFFIPNKEYLDLKLQAKLEAEDRAIQTTPTISESANVYQRQLEVLLKNIMSFENPSSEFAEKLKSIPNNILYMSKKEFSLSAKDKEKIQEEYGNLYFKTPGVPISVSTIFPEKNRKDVPLKTSLTIDEKSASVIVDYVYPLYIAFVNGVSQSSEVVNSVVMEEVPNKEENTVSWIFKIKLNHGAIASATEYEEFIEKIRDKIGEDISKYIKDDTIQIEYKARFTEMNKNKNLINGGFELNRESTGIIYLQNATDVSNLDSLVIEISDEDTEWYGAEYVDAQEVIKEVKDSTDYEDDLSIKFDEYPIGEVTIRNLSCTFGNTYAKIHLQAQSGASPQYMGGQDTIIEVAIQTKDEAAVALLSDMPKRAAEFVRTYRSVLPCWPLRIDSEITRLFGVFEVLVENVEVATVPGYPGLYDITMRLVSIDRTVRNKEALKKLDVDSYSGSIKKGTEQVTVTRSFFELQDVLAKAEVYPDLELPTLDELSQAGFKFLRYSNSKAAYPDPDFYFMYGHVLFNELMRDTIINSLYESVYSINGATKYQIKKIMFGDNEALIEVDNNGNLSLEQNQEIIIRNESVAIKARVTSVSANDFYVKINEQLKKYEKKIDEKWFVINPKDRMPSFNYYDLYGGKITMKPKDGEEAFEYEKNSTSTEIWSETQKLIEDTKKGLKEAYEEVDKEEDIVSSTDKSLEKQKEKALQIFASLNINNAWNIGDVIKYAAREQNLHKIIYSNQNESSNLAQKIKQSDEDLIKAIDKELRKEIEIQQDTINKKETSVLRSLDPKNKSVGNRFINLIEDDIEQFVKKNLVKKDVYKKLIQAQSDDEAIDESKIKKGVIRLFKSIAAAVSGQEEYAKGAKKKWKPRMFFGGATEPDMIAKKSDPLDDNSTTNWFYRPICYAADMTPTTDYEDAIKNGNVFGTFGIRQYSIEEFENLFKESVNAINQNAMIFADDYYRHLQMISKGERLIIDENGFHIDKDGSYVAESTDNVEYVDVDYNTAQEKLEEYKKALLLCPQFAAEAMWRIMLMWIRRCVKDGCWDSLSSWIVPEIKDTIDLERVKENLIIVFCRDLYMPYDNRYASYQNSSVDFTPQDYDNLLNDMEEIANKVAELYKEKAAEKGFDSTIDTYKTRKDINKLGIGNAEKIQKTREVINEEIEDEAIRTVVSEYIRDKYNNDNGDTILLTYASTTENESSETSEIYDTYQSVLSSSKESFILGKIFAPMVLASTDSLIIYEMLKKEEYDILNSFAESVQQPTSNMFNDTSMTKTLRKFLLAMCGYDLVSSISDFAVNNETITQELGSYVNEQLYIKAAQEPLTYVMHSFYDMVVNDKRGRMLRAFPTFYMMFIDEGREIGLWKLHDNFYNTSAIAEITITKSRKIAADTASIVMSNMFDTFTTDDEDMKNGYNYSLKDAWDSLFSPYKYYLREEYRRNKEASVERIRLKPGIRIHLRMGYGADASALPIVFNGCIAEVGVNEFVEIVAQGDGIELTNPILDNIDVHEVPDREKVLRNNFILNWFKTGVTPKTALVSLLTSKGSWMQKAIYDITQGRFFNSNPFGITHFGDPDYKIIFANGEVGQNIYEAIGTPVLPNTHVANSISKEYALDSPPKLSAHLYGKTYWDLMHICAGASPDFIASVAPFGLRSTIFYGLPHYYYAFDYVKGADGIIREKRKPFQQYHQYNSYTDIIYNNIKASDKETKTVAMGTYTYSGLLNLEKIKKVGPMYVDFDIYPEKQKTMMVDTQFLSKGVAGGQFIPFLNWYKNEFSEKGGYQVAWRMTASALRDSIKDMYQGDLGILGDPSVKPYDRMYIHDIFERMNGLCEVETVVHNFSVYSGFTTSIYPDAIATIDNRNAQISHSLANSVFAKGAAIYTGIFLKSMIRHKQTRPILTAMAAYANKISTHTVDLANKLITLIGKDTLLEYEKLDFVSKIASKLKISHSDVRVWQYIDDAKRLESALSYLKLSNFSSIDELTESIAKLSKLLDKANGDEVLEIIGGAERSGKSLKYKIASKLKSGYTDDVDKAIEMLAKYSDDIKSVQKNILKIEVSNADDIGKIVSLVEKTTQNDDKLKNVLKIVDQSIEISNLDDFGKFVKVAADNTDEAADVIKIIVKNFDDVLDVAKTSSSAMAKNSKTLSSLSKLTFGAATGGTGYLIILAEMALEFIITEFITKSVYEYVERWMQNLQVLQIYPLKYKGDVMVAGLDGHKGIVVGSATENDPGLLEGLLAKYLNTDTTMKSILTTILASEEMMSIAARYRSIQENAERNSMTQNIDLMTQIMQSKTVDELMSSDAYSAMLMNPRISVASKNDAETLKGIKSKYVVASTNNTSALQTNMILVPMSEQLQNSIRNGEIIIYGESSSKQYFNLPNISSNIIKVDCMRNNNGKIVDVPFLRPDAYYTMVKIFEKYKTYINKDASVNEENMCKVCPFVLSSALRIGEDSWWSTGFAFSIQMTGLKKQEGVDLLKQILADNAKLTSKGEKDSDDVPLFIFKDASQDPNVAYFKVIVNPPAN